MKNKKMIGVLCAVGLMVSALAGCGNTADTSQTSTNTGEQSTENSTVPETESSEDTSNETADATTDRPMEQLPIAEEPITLTVAIPVDSMIEDITTNDLTLYIEEQTGINLEFIELSPSDVAAQINAIMNGGELPDIFIGYDFPYDTLCSYVDAGLIQPLDEYIDKWGYNLKNTIMADPMYGESILSYVTYDDHVWAMPSGGALITNYYGTYGMYIQMNYVEALGMDEPKTLEELRGFLQAVKENYPDVIPMTACVEHNFIFQNISQAFQHTDPYTYLKINDGKVEFIGNNEKFKEALEYVKGMVDDGLIDPAAFTQDENTLSTILAQEGDNFGALAVGNYATNVLDTTREEYINSKMTGLLEGPDGYSTVAVNVNSASVRRSMVITSACEYPEEAFRLFDFFLSDDFAIQARVGTEGVQWEEAAEGVLGRDGEQAWFSLLTTQEWIQPSTNVIWHLESFIHSNIMNHCEATANTAKYPLAQIIANDNYIESYKGEAVPQLVMNVEDSTEYNELKTLILDYVKESIANFVLGNRDLSEFDDYCEDLNKMGVDRYIELTQNVYDAMMK